MQRLISFFGILVTFGWMGLIVHGLAPRPKPLDAMIMDAIGGRVTSQRQAAANPDRNLAEMDMILTRDQWDAIHGNNTISRTGRAPIGEERYRWPNRIIYYEFTSDFNDGQRSRIRQGMAEWERYTCLTFRERTNEIDYVRIINGDGCYSHVGRIGGRQDISIQIGGCMEHHIIVHELGHTIGRHHEQNRPDREDYVRILFNNIVSSQAYNFRKYSWGYIRNYGVKYDYWSVMHYSQYAFTNNRADPQRTIETLEPEYQTVIGTVPGVSLKDIQTANLMYECSEHCSETNCPDTAILSEDCRCWCNTGNPSNPVVEWDGVSACIGPDGDTETCLDYNDNCPEWRQEGRCESDRRYMLRNCRLSCQVCGTGATCQDLHETCEVWSILGECMRNPSWMLENCMKACHVCGGDPNPSPGGCVDTSNQCPGLTLGGACEEYEGLIDNCGGSCHVCTTDSDFQCRNWHIECQLWREYGRCNSDSAYMRRHCPRACGICSGGSIPDCKNYYRSDSQCEQWAQDGECVLNPYWMLFHCSTSCRVCGNNAVCQDRHPDCDTRRQANWCTEPENRVFMAFTCPVSCSRCNDDTANTVECGNYDPKCTEWFNQGLCDSNPNLMLRYCPRACRICGPGPLVCKNYNVQCQRWQSEGECESNPDWMHIHCAQACNTCPDAPIAGFTKTLGQHHDGGTAVSASDERACVEVCRTDSGCVAVDWDKFSRTCWRQSTSSCNSDPTPNRCCNHYVKTGSCTDDDDERRGFKFGGIQITASSKETCFQSCRDDSECAGVDWSFQRQRCFRHSQDTECSSVLLPNTCCAHLDKGICTDEFTTTSGGHKNGATKVDLPQPSEAACQESCMSDSGCYAVDWDKRDSGCWKHGQGACSQNVASNDCCNHHTKKSACDTGGGGGGGGGSDDFTTTSGGHKNGATKVDLSQPSEAACQESCISDSGCYAVDWDKRDSGCWKHGQGACSQNVASHDCCNHHSKKSACDTGSGGGGGSDDFTTTSGGHKNGATKVDLSQPSEAACQESCISDSGCYAVDWDKRDSGCWKHGQGACSQNVASHDCCNHHSKKSACNAGGGGGGSSDFTKFDNTKIYGASAIDASGESDCVKKCGEENDCGGVDWDKIGQKCWHFSSSGECSGQQQNDNCCNHYRKNSVTCTNGPRSPTTEHLTESPGRKAHGATKLSSSFSSEQKCKDYCSGRVTCRAVDWNNDTMECWEHKSEKKCSELVREQSCNHWSKVCKVLTEFDSISNMHKRGGLRYNNIDNDEECMARCMARADCWGVDWNNNTKQCWWHGRRSECPNGLVSYQGTTHYKKRSKTC